MGLFPSSKNAPRVVVTNGMMIPNYSKPDDWEKFNALGVTQYGQMTAGSWIYIGTQGILQGTYETFAAAGKKHYGSDLTGKFVLTAGLGGMGGAQPLSVTMNNGVCLAVEVDPHSITRRLETKYLDMATESLDEALSLARDAVLSKKPLSIFFFGDFLLII